MNDNAVLDSVYVEYGPVLRVLAVRYGLPYEEVEDIVQETFLAYFTHYPVDWSSGKMKGMLVRILKNKCIDFWRKKRPELVVLADGGNNLEYQYQSFLIFKDTLSVILEREERREIWEALKMMRADWLEVFVLYVIQGRPIQEVSEILGISVEACRTRISRGRKYLKTELKKRANGPGSHKIELVK